MVLVPKVPPTMHGSFRPVMRAAMPYITLCIGRGILGKPEAQSANPSAGAMHTVLACHCLFFCSSSPFAAGLQCYAQANRTMHAQWILSSTCRVGLSRPQSWPWGLWDVPSAAAGQLLLVANNGYWLQRLTIGARAVCGSALSVNITTTTTTIAVFTAAATRYRDLARGRAAAAGMDLASTKSTASCGDVTCCTNDSS
ncbi:hypothetical protein TARUN_5875 [Trichoderma arundinaceum]|uniref:Uncharacterized protein n=1 Tax=Trichoderma arundinaceum TaxID=490622 RepID=A0A395NKH7_TRIAR|nr:hypothetical protein TARUN_5875 [Trichoderma arundinaceum]